ncbi:hypothetical protein [Helicobacter sp. MIT 01-3238]|uniref:hypothetical protein n=1 Tax=Helicobacter sp. MIT 01-3238 TaxID=398627 RepID=UPI0011C07284|nr:hypothetical protein [Helicobacter sp. MIT 01-3238]
MSAAIHKIKEKTLAHKRAITLDRLPRFCTLKRNFAMIKRHLDCHEFDKSNSRNDEKLTHNAKSVCNDEFFRALLMQKIPTPKPPPQREGA